MFLIIDETEELPFPLPNQTKDGKPGRFVYRRLTPGKVRALQMKYQLDGATASGLLRSEYEDAIIKAGFIRSEGVAIRRGDIVTEVSMTVDQVLEIDPRIRSALVKFIEGELYERPELAPPSVDVVLPNSEGTSEPCGPAPSASEGTSEGSPGTIPGYGQS